MSNYKVKTTSHSFEVNVAEALSVNKAILLKEFENKCEYVKNTGWSVFGGLGFIKYSATSLKKKFTYMSENTIPKWLRQLQDDGYLFSLELSDNTYNRSKFFAINPVKYNKLKSGEEYTKEDELFWLKQTFLAICQKDNSGRQKDNNICHNGESICQKYESICQKHKSLRILYNILYKNNKDIYSYILNLNPCFKSDRVNTSDVYESNHKEPMIDLGEPTKTIEQGLDQTKVISLPPAQQKLWKGLGKSNKKHFDAIIEITDYFNKVKGSRKPYMNKGRIKLILKWLNAKYLVEDFKKVIDYKMVELKDLKNGDYLEMETFFRENKFETNLEKANEQLDKPMIEDVKDFRLSTNESYILHCCQLLEISKGYEKYLMSESEFNEMWNKSALLRNCGDDLWRDIALHESINLLKRNNELKNGKDDLKVNLMNFMGRSYKELSQKITHGGTRNVKQDHPMATNWKRKLNDLKKSILETTQNKVECM